MSEFKDLTVVVTGAAGSAIGGPISLAFAREGARIVGCDTHARRLGEMARQVEELSGHPMRTFVLDVSDLKAVEAMMAEIPSVDVLVCSAADNGQGPFLEMDIPKWYRVIDTTLTAQYLFSRLAIPKMIERGGGTIIMIGSVAAWTRAQIGPGAPDFEGAYQAAKAGLNGLTRAIATEFGEHNIRCNLIAPGIIESKYIAKYRDKVEGVLQQTPLKRFGKPEDVVESVLFLASSKRAGYITGECLTLAGGWFMHA